MRASDIRYVDDVIVERAVASESCAMIHGYGGKNGGSSWATTWLVRSKERRASLRVSRVLYRRSGENYERRRKMICHERLKNEGYVVVDRNNTLSEFLHFL